MTANRHNQAPAGSPLTAATPPSVGAELTEEQLTAVFAQRAEALAAVPMPRVAADTMELLVFDLGDERYAFPSAQVRELRPLGVITPVPGAPAFIAGVTNVRGRVVPILDLRPYFGLPLGGEAAQTVLILTSSQGDVGIVATAHPVMHALPPNELDNLPLGASPGLDTTYVRGVTPEFIVVLDAERLLADRRLIIDEGA